ncbi:efflux RND transporter periplasmic adaptor subunit [bacterium]|nr:efflux RND transporter periplasmic adaptor subunit [bacterium]
MDKLDRTFAVSVLALSLCAAGLSAADKVGATGHIVPAAGIVKVAALRQGVLSEIKAQRGDVVKKGAPLFTLVVPTSSLAEVELAKLDLRDATENGAKAVELQKLKIQAATTELDIAEKRLARFESMGQDFSALSQKEEREYQVKSARKSLEIAQAELEHMTLTNTININRATERLKAARGALDLCTVLAPVDGTVIDYFQNPGEVAGTAPSLILADLRTMYVVAEISESDVLKLKEGLAATVTHSAISTPLTGRVEYIGRFVADNVKTANVRIRLDQAEPASRLLNMEVNVTIDLGAGIKTQ